MLANWRSSVARLVMAIVALVLILPAAAVRDRDGEAAIFMLTGLHDDRALWLPMHHRVCRGLMCREQDGVTNVAGGIGQLEPRRERLAHFGKFG